jgi:xanthine dehydrogenase large subunit
MTLLANENREPTIFRSKAVGEPPLMLAISVFAAISDAIASLAGYRLMPALDAPATPERVLLAIEDIRARQASAPSRPNQAQNQAQNQARPAVIRRARSAE